MLCSYTLLTMNLIILWLTVEKISRAISLSLLLNQHPAYTSSSFCDEIKLCYLDAGSYYCSPLVSTRPKFLANVTSEGSVEAGTVEQGSVEVTGDGAAPGPEGGGPVPAAPAPQTLLARCVLSAARCLAGVGTIVAFSVSVSSSVSTSATVVSLT